MVLQLAITDTVKVANVLADKVIFTFGAMKQLLSDKKQLSVQDNTDTCKSCGIKEDKNH